MKRVYKQGYAVKRDNSPIWVLHLHSGQIVGTCRRAGKKYGHRWRVSPYDPQPAHRLFADTLGDAIETAAKWWCGVE
jgi:hypothetical protein